MLGIESKIKESLKPLGVQPDFRPETNFIQRLRVRVGSFAEGLNSKKALKALALVPIIVSLNGCIVVQCVFLCLNVSGTNEQTKEPVTKDIAEYMPLLTGTSNPTAGKIVKDSQGIKTVYNYDISLVGNYALNNYETAAAILRALSTGERNIQVGPSVAHLADVCSSASGFTVYVPSDSPVVNKSLVTIGLHCGNKEYYTFLPTEVVCRQGPLGALTPPALPPLGSNLCVSYPPFGSNITYNDVALNCDYYSALRLQGKVTGKATVLPGVAARTAQDLNTFKATSSTLSKAFTIELKDEFVKFNLPLSEQQVDEGSEWRYIALTRPGNFNQVVYAVIPKLRNPGLYGFVYFFSEHVACNNAGP